MYMQLEDEFGDIIGKARRGQELSVADLADQSNVSEDDIVRMEAYELTPDDDSIRRLAAALGLSPDKLQASAARGFFPLYPNGRAIDGLIVEMMVLGSDFLMNGYVVGCSETGQGAVVDPGFDAEKILRTVESTGMDIQSVLLTHGHGDHVGALSRSVRPRVLQLSSAKTTYRCWADCGPKSRARSEMAKPLPWATPTSWFGVPPVTPREASR